MACMLRVHAGVTTFRCWCDQVITYDKSYRTAEYAFEFALLNK